MNRLNNFHASKFAKPARKADRLQLLQADRVVVPFTSKLGKNEQGFNDLASLIESLIADLGKESQEAKVEEDHSQKDNAAFVSESSQSRVDKINKVEELQNTKASLSWSLSKVKRVPPPGIGGVDFGSSHNLATDHTICELCLPSECGDANPGIGENLFLWYRLRGVRRPGVVFGTISRRLDGSNWVQVRSGIFRA